MSAITTHVLDLSTGKPAAGLAVELDRQEGGRWEHLGSGVTDDDGRLRSLLPTGLEPAAGTYRIRFDTGAYFARGGTPAFYPWVEVVFVLARAGGHYHVPLLLSPFGYSTYRGS